MLTRKETYKLLEEFFNDCVKFWILSGVKDYREAFTLAIKDVAAIQSDPYSPQGELLNTEAKKQFIENRRMDLGNK